ncbi:hypothetical protein [Pedobacter sp. JY14-1]|nr:hypothetical protein [Pedobacter sp. JY14-1]
MFSSLCMIFLGIMMKFSTPGDGWYKAAKYANYFIIGGVILLVLDM